MVGDFPDSAARLNPRLPFLGDDRHDVREILTTGPRSFLNVNKAQAPCPSHAIESRSPAHPGPRRQLRIGPITAPFCFHLVGEDPQHGELARGEMRRKLWRHGTGSSQLTPASKGCCTVRWALQTSSSEEGYTRPLDVA